MANKPSRTIEEQINLLESRGMNIRDRQFVADWLQRVSYFRLKGYWWEMQDDPVNHHFRKGLLFARNNLSSLCPPTNDRAGEC